MKVLITGGAGYLGAELISRFSQCDFIERVICYDNLSRSNFNLFIHNTQIAEKVSFVFGDILDRRTLLSAMDGVDAVLHLAAKTHSPLLDHGYHSFEQVNQWGTASVVDAVAATESITSLVYSSSTSVYGEEIDLECEKGVDTPPRPKSIYGTSKYKGELQIGRLAGSAVEAYILRIANLYGYNPCMRFDTVVNRFMFDANFKGKLAVVGSGHQYRPFVSVQRAAQAFVSLLSKRDAIPQGTYNIVDNNFTIDEVAAAVCEVYTGTDVIYNNQGMHLEGLRVITVPGEQRPLLDGTAEPFVKELIAFSGCFSGSKTNLRG